MRRGDSSVIHYGLNPTLLHMAAKAEDARVYGLLLGLTEGEVKEEISAESARSYVRPEPFDWDAVRKGMLDRAKETP
jgi:hypothetical protein